MRDIFIYPVNGKSILYKIICPDRKKIDFFSKYILRGQNLDDDPVFQSSIGAGYGDLTAAGSDGGG